MTSAQTLNITPGTWNIDTAHSSVNFSVRHMVVSKVKGQFKDFSGQITVADEIENSSVNATIAVSSISTGQAQRDQHLQSTDFFAEDKGQTIEFKSNGVKADGDNWVVDGEITINGITKPQTLNVEFNGAAAEGQIAGFEATAELNRKDFDVNFDMPAQGGTVVIGDKITITIDVEAGLAQ